MQAPAEGSLLGTVRRGNSAIRSTVRFRIIFYHVVLGHIPQITYSVIILSKNKKIKPLLNGRKVQKLKLRIVEHPVQLVSGSTRSSLVLPENITFTSG